MTTMLKPEQQRDLLSRGFSRRTFGKIAALIATGSVFPIFSESSLAQLSAIRGPIPADAVKIDANENPLGPCPEAIAAASALLKNGGRYMYAETDAFVETLAGQEGLKIENVKAYPGSSAPLHHAVITFTSPEKPFITADPGYEAGEMAARFIGAKAIRVPLTKSCAHDVKAMVAAASSASAGLMYVCNPNNPTGTITPREDIEWLVANLPKGTILLLDEAYIHIAGEKMGSDFVAQGKDVIILRTFSKIYGMAGLRAGAALARPDLLQKMGQYNAGALPITGMAAANASLKSAGLVEQRRKIIGAVRQDTLAFLKARGFELTPAVSNCFMVNVKRPGGEIVSALRNEKIYIGRVWPSWPTFVRVTVGTQDEMEKFKAAFLKVMA